MSDLDRNYASPFGRAAGRVDAATVDAGLRAYILRIYNYMSIGLAITGLAALGAYMLSVTSDPASAAYVVRGGRIVPAVAGMAMQSRDILLTSTGGLLYVSPLKWVIVEDEFGRTLALQYPKTSVIVFPLTMISKRVEDARDVDVVSIYRTVVTQVERVAPAAGRGDVQSSVLLYCRLDRSAADLRPEMTGHARVCTGARPVGAILLDRALRLLRTEFWW